MRCAIRQLVESVMGLINDTNWINLVDKWSDFDNVHCKLFLKEMIKRGWSAYHG